MTFDILNFSGTLALGVAIGTNIWNTYQGVHLLQHKAKIGERLFGDIRSKDFQRFFALQFLCFVISTGVTHSLLGMIGIGLCVLQLFAIGRWTNESMRKWSASASSFLSLSLPLSHPLTLLSRWDAKEKKEDPKSERAETKALRKKFFMFHGIGMMIDLALFVREFLPPIPR